MKFPDISLFAADIQWRLDPQSFLDKPRGVANQVDLDIFITIGTWASQISEQVSYDHALAVGYEGPHDVGRQTDPISVLGNHRSVLPS